MKPALALTLLAIGLPLLVNGALAADAERLRMPNPFFAMDTGFLAHYPQLEGPPDASLDMVKALGYKGIAWTLGDLGELKTVTTAAHKRGLKIYALYCGATLRRDRLEVDPRLKEAMDQLRGSETLIWLHIGSTDFARSSADGDAIAAPALRELAGYAAERKLRIALYPHVGDWTERVQDADRVARLVDRKNLGVTFNLCHCLRVGDEEKIPALLEQVAPRLLMVTVNGADTGAAGAPWSRLIQTLDRGSYDLRPLLARLKAIRYRGPIGLQGYGIGGDLRDNLRRAMEKWMKLVDG